jgi:hypothetical protein
MLFYPTLAKRQVCKHATKVDAALISIASYVSYEVHRHGEIKAIPYPTLPPGIKKGADSGGYSVVAKYNGIYPFTLEQYVIWLENWLPDWAATMDYPCFIEEGTPVEQVKQIVQKRQDDTTALARAAWDTYKDRPWCWCPTIQGRSLEDYLTHIEQLRGLLEEMYTFYQKRHQLDTWRVGIGSLVGRPIPEIYEILYAISAALPGIQKHAWGLPLTALKYPRQLPPDIASVDSASWCGGKGEKRFRYKDTEHSQYSYLFAVSLPDYQQKIARALETPKYQNSLFEE